ncbi:NAD(+) diphosphatase [Xylanibacter muris]|uniref:NAD(+) diphosphatase n=1 Tax=Xylanibacter muris TaxID=2736290 RepID=A0ABX2AJZ8_9BACT|nr:NAD(+) diphosphatase [Xylanibacter muris]NPD91400.1 NAD(+) diphosphatase [Xylanibacter muris]
MKNYYFVFCNGEILIEKRPDGSYTVPFTDEPPTIVSNDTNILKVTGINGTEVRTYKTDMPVTDNKGYEMCPLRQSYYKLDHEMYLEAGKCSELIYWDSSTKYCGSCGAPMSMQTEISKICTKCGKEIWPQLATAVIVLVRKTRTDEILLVHARNFKSDFFGLVAGFVETGETLEEAVKREVMEETGISITNIQYFGSQPWPYPCGLMIGFNAEYENGEIRLQESELSAGAWFNRENLPRIPEKMSIARKLIDAWKEKTPPCL